MTSTQSNPEPSPPTLLSGGSRQGDLNEQKDLSAFNLTHPEEGFKVYLQSAPRTFGLESIITVLTSAAARAQGQNSLSPPSVPLNLPSSSFPQVSAR